MITYLKHFFVGNSLPSSESPPQLRRQRSPQVERNDVFSRVGESVTFYVFLQLLLIHLPVHVAYLADLFRCQVDFQGRLNGGKRFYDGSTMLNIEIYGK